MKNFIVLSFVVINISSIKKIDVKPTRYNIHLTDYEFTGFFNIFKIGGLSSKHSEIEISKIAFPQDYDKITKWLKIQDDGCKSPDDENND